VQGVALTVQMAQAESDRVEVVGMRRQHQDVQPPRDADFRSRAVPRTEMSAVGRGCVKTLFAPFLANSKEKSTAQNGP
jgi:hypothetical protein